jgi:hypothetical protein
MEFIIHKDGEILHTGNCPESMITAQSGSDGEVAIAGHGNQETQKVVDGVIVDKTQTELNEYRLTKQSMKRPYVTGTETDLELNQLISDHFYNLIEPSTYRIANYYWLREKFYPSSVELNDAQIKINSGITALEEEGEEQLEDYVNDCLAVKTRFPKE